MTKATKDAPSKTGKETLQLRLDTSDIKQIKLAAIQQNYKTIAAFMWCCFLEHQESRK
jgi:uncharacterized protein (DUF1778 family)